MNIESGVQLFSRIQSEKGHVLDGIYPKLFPNGGPFGNQVIEVLFDKETDPTDFFADVIVKALLPSHLKTESQVIFFNTEAQLNIFKIIKFMEKKLPQCSQKTAIVEECLSRLVILNCYTADNLETTFHNVENIIRNCDNASLVILDNSLSQYWAKRFEVPMLSFDRHSSHIVNSLFTKVKDLNVVLMYGRWRATDCQKKTSLVDYSIQITRKEKGRSYVAKVTDWGKSRSFEVAFDVDVGVEFHMK